MVTAPPPLVWVTTDLGPTPDPAYLISAVPVIDTNGDLDGHVWADSATPYSEPGALVVCEHDGGYVRTDLGLYACLDCTEQFHPDQLVHRIPDPTAATAPFRLEPGHRDLYVRPPRPPERPRKASDYYVEYVASDPNHVHRWRSVHGGRTCRSCGAVDVTA